MVRASRGLRTGTRRKLKKGFRDKFKITPYMREFREQEKVTVSPNPFSHDGMPHIRFKGASGTVIGKRGKAVMIEVNIGGKKKTITTRPEHLTPV